MNTDRKLVLADGTVFLGTGFGSNAQVIAEVIFFTGMTGYQEVLTDPSYNNQIVVMTYPMIGNYGISNENSQLTKNIAPTGAAALIVKEHCETPSNWSSAKSLDEFLKEKNIPGLCNVDTRALTIKIRETGTIKGIIIDANIPDADAIAKLNSAPTGNDNAKRIVPKESYKVATENKKFRIVLLSFGAKMDKLIEELVNRGCEIIVASYDVSTGDISSLNPDGIVLGNGSGNPADLSEVLPTIKELQTKYPLLGVCLGHQLFALANDATTSKMKFGHHGDNVPVKDITTGRTLITSQNHNYQVDADSLTETDLELTHYAINDNTVQGVKHKLHPAFSVQFLPEAHVGPQESKYLFDQFIESLGV